MREHPQTATAAATDAQTHSEALSSETHSVEAGTHHADHAVEPVMVEKPVVAAAETSLVSAADDRPAEVEPVETRPVETKPVPDRAPDLFDPAPSTPVAVPAPGPDDKTGKSDVAAS